MVKNNYFANQSKKMGHIITLLCIIGDQNIWLGLYFRYNISPVSFDMVVLQTLFQLQENQ